MYAQERGRRVPAKAVEAGKDFIEDHRKARPGGGRGFGGWWGGGEEVRGDADCVDEGALEEGVAVVVSRRYRDGVRGDLHEEHASGTKNDGLKHQRSKLAALLLQLLKGLLNKRLIYLSFTVPLSRLNIKDLI